MRIALVLAALGVIALAAVTDNSKTVAHEFNDQDFGAFCVANSTFCNVKE